MQQIILSPNAIMATTTEQCKLDHKANGGIAFLLETSRTIKILLSVLYKKLTKNLQKTSLNERFNIVANHKILKPEN